MSAVIRIPLTRGYSAIIDAADLPLVAGRKWHATRGTVSACTYAAARIGAGIPKMHSLIIPSSGGLIIDHINGDGLDNRRCNLRLVSRQINTVNRSTAYSTSTTGLLNVYRRGSKFYVRVFLSQPGNKTRSIQIGTFDTIEKAAVAAYEARLKHYGPESVARLQKPAVLAEGNATR